MNNRVIVAAAVVLIAASSTHAQTGACCFCDGCVLVTAGECDGLGGEYQGDGSVCSTFCTDEIYMPDPNLRAAVQAELSGCLLTEFNMLSLLSLDAPDLGIIDLTGLENAASLTDLRLEKN
ncbi:MAG: hypothetical protein ACYTAQ_14030, partial [Planctomycetota bacterium]